MTILALPDDHSAVLRDARKIPERLRRPVVAALMKLAPSVGDDMYQTDAEGNIKVDPTTGAPLPKAAADVGAQMLANGGMEAFSDANDLLVLAFVKSWDLTDENDAVLPVSLESLLEIDGDIYDALQAAVANRWDDVMPKNFSASPDPVSPTAL